MKKRKIRTTDILLVSDLIEELSYEQWCKLYYLSEQINKIRKVKGLVSPIQWDVIEEHLFDDETSQD